MNNVNFYTLYGLKVKSEIHLYDSILLKANFNNYDVEIVLGEMSESKKNTCTKIGNFYFSSDYSSFNIPEVACYEILNGNKIVIEAKENSNNTDVKKFLIGSALGLLLFQKNIIALHGGAISINGNGIIISGSIGAGKTTTISTLVNKGYGFLTDDVSSITKDSSGAYTVNHCIPYQKLCHSTVEMLGYNTNNLIKIDKHKNKYFSPEIKNFIKEPVKLKALFYLSTSTDDNINFEEIRGAEKFNIIFSNIFRAEFIPKAMFKPTFIKECLALANNISVFKITRPKNTNSINQVVSTIEKLTLRGNM